jgi:hypothetical protein
MNNLPKNKRIILVKNLFCTILRHWINAFTLAAQWLLMCEEQEASSNIIS